MPDPTTATPSTIAATAAPAARPAPATKRSFLHRLTFFAFKAIGTLVFVAAAIVGFGTSADDFTSLNHFTRSVQNWQTNPEFRQVAMQYVTRGSDAMRSRPMGFTAAQWIVAIRSIPGMPPKMAINPTSRDHYANFSKGPLSAYLHLCTEVDLLGRHPDGSVDSQNGYLPEYEGLFGKSAGWSREELYGYLAKQHWDYEVRKDAGAVESLRSMLSDVEINRPLKVREMHVNDLLMPHIRSLAAELSQPGQPPMPGDPEAMTPQEQYAVFDRLDAYVRRNDPELWRTKQVSDFIGGIWGQVFSPPYTQLLGPYVAAVPACQWFVLLTLAVGVVVFGRRVHWHILNDAKVAATAVGVSKPFVHGKAAATGTSPVGSDAASPFETTSGRKV